MSFGFGQQAYFNEDSYSTIIELLSTGDPDVQITALFQLSETLSYGNDESLGNFPVNRIAELLVNCLDMNSNQDFIQSQAAQCISNFLDSHTRSTRALIEHGALDMILKILNTSTNMEVLDHLIHATNVIAQYRPNDLGSTIGLAPFIRVFQFIEQSFQAHTLLAPTKRAVWERTLFSTLLSITRETFYDKYLDSLETIIDATNIEDQKASENAFNAALNLLSKATSNVLRKNQSKMPTIIRSVCNMIQHLENDNQINQTVRFLNKLSQNDQTANYLIDSGFDFNILVGASIADDSDDEYEEDTMETSTLESQNSIPSRDPTINVDVVPFRRLSKETKTIIFETILNLLPVTRFPVVNLNRNRDSKKLVHAKDFAVRIQPILINYILKASDIEPLSIIALAETIPLTPNFKITNDLIHTMCGFAQQERLRPYTLYFVNSSKDKAPYIKYGLVSTLVQKPVNVFNSLTRWYSIEINKLTQECNVKATAFDFKQHNDIWALLENLQDVSCYELLNEGCLQHIEQLFKQFLSNASLIKNDKHTLADLQPLIDGLMKLLQFLPVNYQQENIMNSLNQILQLEMTINVNINEQSNSSSQPQISKIVPDKDPQPKAEPNPFAQPPDMKPVKSFSSWTQTQQQSTNPSDKSTAQVQPKNSFASAKPTTTNQSPTTGTTNGPHFTSTFGNISPTGPSYQGRFSLKQSFSNQQTPSFANPMRSPFGYSRSVSSIRSYGNGPLNVTFKLKDTVLFGEGIYNFIYKHINAHSIQMAWTNRTTHLKEMIIPPRNFDNLTNTELCAFFQAFQEPNYTPCTFKFNGTQKLYPYDPLFRYVVLNTRQNPDRNRFSNTSNSSALTVTPANSNYDKKEIDLLSPLVVPTFAIDKQMANVLHLLKFLKFEVFPFIKEPTTRNPIPNLKSHKFESRLTAMISSAYQVATCLHPSIQIIANYPFLFSYETRFYVYKSITLSFYASVKNAGRLKPLLQMKSSTKRRPLYMGSNSSSGNLNNPQNDSLTDHSTYLKVQINRERLFEDGCLLLETFGHPFFFFDISYIGEEGIGVGPTREFFSSMGKEFCKNKRKMWRPEFLSKEVANDESFVQNGHGLYPMVNAPLHLFELLGKLCGKAVEMDYLISIPFSTAFFKAFKGLEVDLKDIDPILANSLDKATAESMEFLPFVYPGTEIELKENGKNIEIDESNFDEYKQLVKKFTLNLDAVDAFKRGFHSVVSPGIDDFFTPMEFIKLICGHNLGTSNKITKNDIKDSTIVSHGYTARSPQIDQLYEIIESFSNEEQQLFIKFVTGCERLPVGGLSNLMPPLTIARKEPEDSTQSPDQLLPSVMTCTNYFKLPAYSSKEIMRQKLLIAISEGQGAFLLT